MSFILRAVVILLIFSFIIFVFKAIARLTFNLRGAKRDIGQLRERLRREGQISDEMVRCNSCGAYVAVSDAVELRLGRKVQSYCSEGCLNKHRVRA